MQSLDDWTNSMYGIHQHTSKSIQQSETLYKGGKRISLKKLEALNKALEPLCIHDLKPGFSTPSVFCHDFCAGGCNWIVPKLTLHPPCLKHNKEIHSFLMYVFQYDCSISKLKRVSNAVQKAVGCIPESKVYGFVNERNKTFYLYCNLATDFMRICLFYYNVLYNIISNCNHIQLKGDLYLEGSIVPAPNSGLLTQIYNNGNCVQNDVAFMQHIFRVVVYNPINLITCDTHMYTKFKIPPFSFVLSMNVYTKLQYNKLVKCYIKWLDKPPDPSRVTSLTKSINFIQSIEPIPKHDIENAKKECASLMSKFGIGTQSSMYNIFLHMMKCMRTKIVPTLFRLKHKKNVLLLFPLAHKKLKKMDVQLVFCQKPPLSWATKSHEVIYLPCFETVAVKNGVLVPDKQKEFYVHKSFVRNENLNSKHLSIMCIVFIQLLMGRNLCELTNTDTFVYNSTNHTQKKARRS